MTIFDQSAAPLVPWTRLMEAEGAAAAAAWRLPYDGLLVIERNGRLSQIAVEPGETITLNLPGFFTGTVRTRG